MEKFTSIWYDSQLAAHYNWCIFQMDVTFAILNGVLWKKFMWSNLLVLKFQVRKLWLKKVVYGLKQAPKGWSDKIDSFFPLSSTDKGHYLPRHWFNWYLDVGLARYLTQDNVQLAISFYLAQILFLEVQETKFSFYFIKRSWISCLFGYMLWILMAKPNPWPS